MLPGIRERRQRGGFTMYTRPGRINRAQFPRTNFIRVQETTDTASMSAYGVAKDDLESRIFARERNINTAQKTQQIWKLDDLDSDTVMQLLKCMSLQLSFLPYRG